MIAYLGDAAGLEETDIPHRSKALTLITNEYTSKYQSLKNDVMVCPLFCAILDVTYLLKSSGCTWPRIINF